MKYVQLIAIIALQWVNGRIVAAMSAVHTFNDRLINKGLAILGERQDSK